MNANTAARPSSFAKLICAALFMGAAMAASAADNVMKAFPAAEPDVSRYVITMPAIVDESSVKVELLIGKVVKVDAANRYFFSGQLQAEDIPGWGYTRYVLNDLGQMAGTLMAAKPDAKEVDRFVSLGGEPQLLRYNSRMPIVVYVPKNVEVRYRLWRAGGKAKLAKQN